MPASQLDLDNSEFNVETRFSLSISIHLGANNATTNQQLVDVFTLPRAPDVSHQKTL